MSQPNVAISATHVSFKYPGNDYYSLNDISVTIKAGSCTGIIGPNGAGKSTFISLLCGLLIPEKGQIIYHDCAELSIEQAVKNQVALIPQEYAFYPQLTIKQNLDYFVALSERDKYKRPQIISQTLAQCALSDVAHRKAQSLSGGYKRRLNIAIALSKQPTIIFLDEPTVGIDPISRQHIIDLLLSLKKAGKTLIYTSHMLNEVEQICDEVVLLNHGQAIATSSNDNQQMFLSVEFMPSSQAITQLLPSADIVSQQEGSLEIKIKDNADLKQQLLALSQAGPLIKNLHFSQNSIDHLYFNSYRGQ
ncbi:MAG: ABC transporter ATP-binding protein [Gammaproteobacteria bacterium]|nr:ABC transporter ATP-binding protein [Gammaproteobacteria bacterium]